MSVVEKFLVPLSRLANGIHRANMSGETSQESNKDAFLIQARQVREGCDAGFAISVSPASVTKKLAIRRMNGEIEGWTAQSNTAPKAAR
jgi:hypothetical protein